MKKNILIILFWGLLLSSFSQTITPTGIGFGTRRTNATSNVDFVVSPQKLNPGPLVLPNQIILVNKLGLQFTFTPPTTYANPATNQIIHKLKYRSGSSVLDLGTPQSSAAFAPQGSTSINSSIEFANLGIVTYSVTIPIPVSWTFFIESYASDGFGHETFISSTQDYTFTRSLQPDEIYNNVIGNDQIIHQFPYTPQSISQVLGPLPQSTDGSDISFQWYQSVGSNTNYTIILGATAFSYLPSVLYKNTWYKRKATSDYGIIGWSNEVKIYLPDCPNDAALINDQFNTICGSQSYYDLQDGQLIFPSNIIGSVVTPNITSREFGYEYHMSTDGSDGPIVKPATVITLDNNGNFDHSLANLNLEPFVFDIRKGSVQRIYFKRKYFHWYDDWKCNEIPHPCGADWHSQGYSNTVVITLTTGPLKPVGPLKLSAGYTNQATCNWSDQTKGLEIDRVNNGEFYQWELPSYYTAYSPISGNYANTMQFSTNANPENNYVRGGEVCVTITQMGHTDRRCFTIKGTQPFSATLPATLSACEGQTVLLKSVLLEGTNTANYNNYNYTWTPYQSPSNASCNTPSGAGLLNGNCNELKMVMQYGTQFQNQEVDLTVRNTHGCSAKTKTFITTTPGWQIGILHAYDDPKALPGADLALDAAKNYMYFTSDAGIYRAYFDNGPDKVWKYVLLKDKNTNAPIKGSGGLQYDKGTTDKLYYVRDNNLYYAESTDQGQTWTNFNNLIQRSGIDKRFKIYGSNLYYVSLADRKIYYCPLNNLNGPAVMVGNVLINSTEGLFTVEDGILGYADNTNTIALFNAITGAPLSITIATTTGFTKQITGSSAINICAGNIYYVVDGVMRILKKDINGAYSSYEDVPGNNQLAGTFTINKQTGTIYAKSYYPEARQLYYLNGIWHSDPIRQYVNGGAIGGNVMIYGNGHVYFINTGNILGNAFYVAPCVPSVLRTGAENGDPMNDPLSNTIPEIHVLSLVPNPASDQVKVAFTIPKASNLSLQLVSVSGSGEVIKEIYAEAGAYEWKLNVSQYPAGVYIVQVITDGHVFAHTKLIKY